MPDKQKAARAYDDWRKAEERYARALAAFAGDGPPAKVRRESALALAEVRSRADSARDKYFKHALR